MNDRLQKDLSTLEDLIKIQRHSVVDEYMRGLLNGLIVAHSVVGKCEYIKMQLAPEGKKTNKVRHRKSRRK